MEQNTTVVKPFFRNFLANGNRNNGYHEDEELLTDSVGNLAGAGTHIMAGPGAVAKPEQNGRNRSQSATSSPYTNNYRIPSVHQKHYRNHQSHNNTPIKTSSQQQQQYVNSNANKSSLHSSMSQLPGEPQMGYGHGRTLSNFDVANPNGSSPFRGKSGSINSSIFGGSSNDVGIEESGMVQIVEIPDPSGLGNHRCFWTAMYDYEAQGEDELSLSRGELVEVLSKDAKISGDEGWWTGKIGNRQVTFNYNLAYTYVKLCH